MKGKLRKEEWRNETAKEEFRENDDEKAILLPSAPPLPTETFLLPTTARRRLLPATSLATLAHRPFLLCGGALGIGDRSRP